MRTPQGGAGGHAGRPRRAAGMGGGAAASLAVESTASQVRHAASWRPCRSWHDVLLSERERSGGASAASGVSLVTLCATSLRFDNHYVATITVKARIVRMSARLANGAASAGKDKTRADGDALPVLKARWVTILSDHQLMADAHLENDAQARHSLALSGAAAAASRGGAGDEPERIAALRVYISQPSPRWRGITPQLRNISLVPTRQDEAWAHTQGREARGQQQQQQRQQQARHARLQQQQHWQGQEQEQSDRTRDWDCEGGHEGLPEKDDGSVDAAVAALERALALTLRRRAEADAEMADALGSAQTPEGADVLAHGRATSVSGADDAPPADASVPPMPFAAACKPLSDDIMFVV